MMPRHVSLISDEDRAILENKEALSGMIRKYLEFLYENTKQEYWFEVRILGLDGSVKRRMFRIKDIGRATNYIIREMNSDSRIKGIYVTINPAGGQKGGSFTNDDILEVINLPIDVDVFHNRAPSEVEVSAVKGAIKRAIQELFGKYNFRYMVVFSGFGFHVYLKVNPVEVGDRNWQAAFREVGRELADEFERVLKESIDPNYSHLVEDAVDKSVYNPSRIMRVAWTVNRRKIGGTIYEAVSKIVEISGANRLEIDELVKKKLREGITTREELHIENMGGTRLNSEEKDALVEALKKYYMPGRRHNLVLGFAAFAWHKGIRVEDTLEVVRRVYVETGDSDPWEDRERAVLDTYSATLKNYRSYLGKGTIWELNRALRSYYQRAMVKKKEEPSEYSVTSAQKVLSNDFDLLEWLIERTSDIIKEVDEKSGRVTYKVSFVVERAGKVETIVLKNTERTEKEKMFYALNEDFMAHFGVYIVDPLSIRKLNRQERSKFNDVLAKIMLDYYAFVTRNAKEIVIEEYEDVKNIFLDIIETEVLEIVKIDELNSISGDRVDELFRKRIMIYAENENRVYFDPHLLEYGAETRGFARTLAKFLHRIGVIDKKTWREVRRSKSLRNGRHVYLYYLISDRFFDFLEKENAIKPPIKTIDEYLDEQEYVDLDEIAGESVAA
ncbi:hypothetical protein [Thermococcus gammatolerans]|uniref:Uncharacterized protein n=1 Tax=Thermococcus gammatolerans (strain DSM 15229 / JCM 11827 / EJ3) TaxID=593117 RepID=C5A7B9_THEGJ|nr:hypothetical protein [Thermococcus gammatolerans]ACS34131.1 Hypothetical protein TGAM_1629 [Thermococcus gammatolerans EJ3]